MTYAPRVYRPRHQQQKLRLTYPDGRSVLIGCTDTSFAMFADATTMGGLKITEAQVRYMSGEATPDPQSPGLNIPQLVKVAKKLHIVFLDRTGMGENTVRGYLTNNQKVVAQLWYAGIGGTNIGHAVLLQALGHNGKILLNDPMKTAPEWVDDDRVFDAMKEFARRTKLTSGLRLGVGRKVQKIAVVV